MKYVLSIDVGIINLALCVASCKDKDYYSSYKIHLWDVIDTIEKETNFCKEYTKKNILCGNKGSFCYNDSQSKIFCCKKHFPKDIQIKKCNIVKEKKIKDYTNHELCKIIIENIEDIYSQNIEIFNKITDVVIELQPSCNRKMVFISNMIYCKLVDMYLDTKTSVKFVSASRKLRLYKGPYISCSLKGKYAQRKWMAIQHCRWFLEKFNIDEKEKWVNFFESKKIKADMSDSFLMALDNLKGK